MAEPLTILRDRHNENWLVGYDRSAIAASLEERFQQLKTIRNSRTSPVICLTERDPLKFLTGFIVACEARCTVVLGNPKWGESEWAQLFRHLSPDLIWGEIPPFPVPAVIPTPPPAAGTILIATGGSSGRLRFAIHTWDTLLASVQGFQAHFQQAVVNSCCVLPLHHVSGLMQLMRSLTSGGQLAVFPFSQLQQSQLGTIAPLIDPQDYFLSLVPTQLHRLLQHSESVDWLRQFHTILLGGAAAWGDLRDRARQIGLPLAPTYGMTETASQIATLRPSEFLRGNFSSQCCGQLLPHASVVVGDRPDQPAPIGAIGSIWITADSLALGYFPTEELGWERGRSQPFQTDDLGFLDAAGYLHIVGRNSQKIITGGENVFPAEVEAALYATGLVAEVCVIGTPDPEWGEAVTALYVPAQPNLAVATLEATVKQRLSRYKCPKRWRSLSHLPRTAQGKVDYAQLYQVGLNAH